MSQTSPIMTTRFDSHVHYALKKGKRYEIEKNNPTNLNIAKLFVMTTRFNRHIHFPLKKNMKKDMGRSVRPKMPSPIFNRDGQLSNTGLVEKPDKSSITVSAVMTTTELNNYTHYVKKKRILAKD